MKISNSRVTSGALIAMMCGCEPDDTPRSNVSLDATMQDEDAKIFDMWSASDAASERPVDATAEDSATDAVVDVPMDTQTPFDVISELSLDVVETSVGDPRNRIQIENANRGTTAWRLTRPSASREIEGYASTTSARAGSPFDLFINVDVAHSAHWEAYRIGYYQGLGGRLIASGSPRVIAHQTDCPVDSETGAIECRWDAAFRITPDASWVSGEYLVKLVRDDGWSSYVPLVVRDENPRAALMFQASVNTWQAYNNWGGTSLYENSLPARVFRGDHAYRVSFDRPYTADDNGSGQLLWWEAYMARWLEQRGYDVTYVTNVDVDAEPTIIDTARMFLSVGHDEYWSIGERNALERARDRGVSLGFFSADTGTFHSRFAPSSNGTTRRALICYKVDAQLLDPARGTPLQTTRFALAPLSRPENALLGVMYAEWSGGARFPMVVSNPEHWIFAGTGVTRGETLEFIVGSEWDRVHNNGLTPASLETVTTSYGLSTEGVTEVSNATVYYPTPTSVVFAAGTLSWALGLGREGVVDSRIQRMTENILARAGVAVESPTVVAPLAAARNPGTARTVTLVAGSGIAGYMDGPAATARFNAPAGVAAHTDGTLYVTDSRNHRVRVIHTDQRVTTLAGCGATDLARTNMFRDATGTSACFDLPTGIVVAPDGTVYVSDTGNHRIRAITPTGVVTTYAGNGTQGSTDATDRRMATFSYPRGLALGTDGALYVADKGNDSVRRITSSGVTTVARDLRGPMGIAVGTGNTLYITSADATLRVVTPTPAILTGRSGDNDYIETDRVRSLLRPGDGIAVLGGNLIFSDAYNHRIRMVSIAAMGNVSTLVGDGRVGGGVGTGATTHVALPRGIARFRDGIAVADSASHRVIFVAP
jgi:sugar lactone lactonase YvrE